MRDKFIQNTLLDRVAFVLTADTLRGIGPIISPRADARQRALGAPYDVLGHSFTDSAEFHLEFPRGST